MKTYHEIFVEPDGSWLARIYQDNQVVRTFEGRETNYGKGLDAAIQSVAAWKIEKGIVDPVREVSTPAPRRPWWRIW